MSFFNELKRRNVIRVGIAYVIVAWLVMQFADVVLNNIDAPGWVFQTIMLVLAIGFPVVLIFAWAFEVTPEGIKKEKDVDRSQSITPKTGRKLDNTIIAVLVLALGYFIYDEIGDRSVEEAALVAETTIQTETATTDETPAGDPSIAVLPFTDMSPDLDQGYFSDGISEELLNLLVRVDGLQVASRTSSFAYKGSNQSLAEIAGELKVDHVLEGSVRKAENRVRITAQLIDASTDRHIWSDTFDRELVDIFAIQDEIANAIVDALRTELGVLTNSGSVAVTADTGNLDAYELYLRARGLFLKRENLEESVALFEKAVEMDPKFARAWEGLGAVYSVVESWEITGRNWDSLALAAAQTALELDPGLSMPWAVMAQIMTNKADVVTALEYFDRAIEIDPRNATHYLWRGITWSSLGFQDKSISDIEQCMELDPAYENCKRHLAISLLVKNENDRAITLFQEGIENGFFGSATSFVPAMLASGNRLAAAVVLYNGDERSSTFPGREILDAIEYPDRDHSRGLSKFLMWIENSDSDPDRFPTVFASFGAFSYVKPNPFSNRWLWLDRYSSFRTSPYFKPFLIGTGVLAYWREKGFPDNCRPVGEDDFECD